MSAWAAAWSDDFAGPGLSERWVGGQLKPSGDCTLAIDEGVRITLTEGTDYASAGVVTRQPIQGDFAAEVAFSVTHPRPGSTLELAAVLVAPPAHTILQPRSRAESALLFNVHGEPPYVSSEFDEDDGWRLGHNRQAASYAIDEYGFPMASGKGNTYGGNSDVKPNGPARGWLRLQRERLQWSAYRRAHADEEWAFMDAVTMPEMQAPVYLRLLAKHWVKKAEHLTRAPANEIVFSRFTLRTPLP